MKVTQIKVANYRNLESQTVTLGSGLNVFVGDNAQGKTNLVESVYLCCIGKSPRAGNDKDLIRWGEKSAFVEVKYLSKFGNSQIDMEFFDGAKKKITAGGVPVVKMGELMGHLNCIYFSPNEIKIISQSPAERRRFLDIDLFQTDKNYFYSLLKHNKALVQRNNALKLARDLTDAQDAVFGWNKIIAEEGAVIIEKRRRFCEKLKPLAEQAHEKLTDGKESFQMAYVTKIAGENLQETQTNYIRALEANIEKDFQLRHTSVGLQRDDIVLKINGVDVRTFGSQGQLRTTALSLKLAELSLFKNIIGEFPVLILDDVLSELDAERQKRLLNFHPELQILLTSATDVSEKLLSENRKIFRIESGSCKEI